MNEYIVEAVHRQWQDERRADAQRQRLIGRLLRRHESRGESRLPAALPADTQHRLTTL
jgi:hypothetical protein